MSYLETIFFLMLSATLRGSVLIVIALTFGPICRRWLGQGTVRWLWAAGLVVLLWPCPPQTSLSAGNLFRRKHAEPTVPLVPVRVQIPEAQVRYVEVPKPAAAPETLSEASWTTSIPEPVSKSLSLRQFLAAAWLAGVGAAFLRLLCRLRKTLLLTRHARPYSSPTSDKIMNRAGLPRRLRLAESDAVTGPALTGVLRPIVLLPSGWAATLAPRQLEFLILHEAGHHRHHDLVWEWLFEIACCLHWMNPLVWLAARRSRLDREMTCDAQVLRQTESGDRYGEAIIAVAQRVSRPRQVLGAISMASSTSQLRQRLHAIIAFTPRPGWLHLIALFIALSLAALIGTDPLLAESANELPVTEVAAPSVPRPAASPAPAALPKVLPIARFEITSQLLRLPASLATEAGLPIAATDPSGVSVTLSRPEYAQLLKRFPSASGFELLPLPTIITSSGHRASAAVTREIRYPETYRESTFDPHLLIPEMTTKELGLKLECEVNGAGEKYSVNSVIRVLRLLGYADQKGTLLRPDAAAGDWFEHLLAANPPRDTAGVPVLREQVARADLALSASQMALVFGFPDTGEGPPMINYFALRIDPLP